MFSASFHIYFAISINANYSNLRDGGSFSVVGFPQIIIYGITSAYGSYSATFSMSLSASTSYALTFSFIKNPMINYYLDQPNTIGFTHGTPYNSGFSNAPSGIIYEVNRVVKKHILNT